MSLLSRSRRWTVGGGQLCLLSTVCCLLLSGCGFEPLYAKKPPGDVSKVFAGVRIDSIPGRQGQEMKASLEDKLNPDGAVPPKPAYRLAVSLSNTVVPIGVARDGTISRYNVYLTSHYTLYRNADNKPVTAGDLSYVNSYNNLTNQYFSTYISEEDAIRRNITEMAELYRERLTAYLDAGAPEQDPKITSAAHAPVAYTPALFNELPGITAPVRPVR